MSTALLRLPEEPAPRQKAREMCCGCKRRVPLFPFSRCSDCLVSHRYAMRRRRKMQGAKETPRLTALPSAKALRDNDKGRVQSVGVAWSLALAEDARRCPLRKARFEARAKSVEEAVRRIMSMPPKAIYVPKSGAGEWWEA